jgi:hypothetical protein
MDHKIMNTSINYHDTDLVDVFERTYYRLYQQISWTICCSALASEHTTKVEIRTYTARRSLVEAGSYVANSDPQAASNSGRREGQTE